VKIKKILSKNGVYNVSIGLCKKQFNHVPCNYFFARIPKRMFEECSAKTW